MGTPLHRQRIPAACSSTAAGSRKPVRTAMDPSARALATPGFFHARRPLVGAVAVVLNGYLENRGLSLIRPISRACPRHSLIELIATDEPDVGPGGSVRDAAYLGFLEVRTGGLIVVGDAVVWKREIVGTIAGFDETHMPNHQNVIVAMGKRTSGKDLGWQLEDRVTIRGRAR